MTQIRSLYSEKRRVSLDQGEAPETCVEQHHKDECDVNKIVAGYQMTGHLNEPTLPHGRYMEVDDLTFQDAMIMVTQAKADFQALPAELRDRFANDPAVFVEFCQNPDNAQEMVDLGLAEIRPDSRTSVQAIDELSKKLTSSKDDKKPSKEG